MQLALAGAVALLVAWLGKMQTAWHRLYFFALGCVFLFLAYDEYAVLHEFIPQWKNYYFALGAAVVAATLAVAGRSARASWKWYGFLLAGLATSALGGLVVETNCGHPIFASIELCANHFFIEEPLEFAGMWLALVALLGQLSVLAPTRHITRMLYVVPLLWLMALAASPAIHAVERYGGKSDPALVEFESGARLLGYRMGKNKDSLHLFLSPARLDFAGRYLSGLGYSIHLIDQVSGESVHGRDRVAHRRFFLLAPRYRPVYRQWTDIARPPTLPINRAFWIALTLWREGESAYRPLRILASDHKLLSDTQVVLGEFVVRAAGASGGEALEPMARFDNGFALEGAEYPERARRRGLGHHLCLAQRYRRQGRPRAILASGPCGERRVVGL